MLLPVTPSRRGVAGRNQIPSLVEEEAAFENTQKFREDKCGNGLRLDSKLRIAMLARPAGI
jgi:hypothetical protein